MEHQYETSATCDCKGEGHCMICEGGLAMCRVCRLYEGSLTSECPGVKSYREHADAIYKGEEDFRNGQWVKAVSCHCPEFYCQWVQNKEGSK